MASQNRKAPENLLLARLPKVVRTHLLSRCEQVELSFGDILSQPDQPFPFVYFPRSGFISLMTTVSGHPPLEMSLIGNEGMLGATLALGVDAAPMLAIVQGAGSAWRIATPTFQQELATSPPLHAVIHRFIYVLLAQLAQSAACTRFHEVEPRLARWLLMSHDRAHVDHFHLTHQFLAAMLGVQRSAITIAAGALQRQQLIHYSRGEINILSRSGLEARACECYGAVVEDYAARFGRAA